MPPPPPLIANVDYGGGGGYWLQRGEKGWYESKSIYFQNVAELTQSRFVRDVQLFVVRPWRTHISSLVQSRILGHSSQAEGVNLYFQKLT